MSSVMIFAVILYFSAFLSVRTAQQKHVIFVTSPFFLLFPALQLWRRASIIFIDTLSKTISFKRLFTMQQTIKSFDDFDGFIDTYQYARGGSYRVIYLVRQKRFVKQISSFYYSNLDELQEALTPMKYLGEQNFNLIKSVKILFKLPVLK
jgi:hypothetical protein